MRITIGNREVRAVKLLGVAPVRLYLQTRNANRLSAGADVPADVLDSAILNVQELRALIGANPFSTFVDRLVKVRSQCYRKMVKTEASIKRYKRDVEMLAHMRELMSCVTNHGGTGKHNYDSIAVVRWRDFIALATLACVHWRALELGRVKCMQDVEDAGISADRWFAAWRHFLLKPVAVPFESAKALNELKDNAWHSAFVDAAESYLYDLEGRPPNTSKMPARLPGRKLPGMSGPHSRGEVCADAAKMGSAYPFAPHKAACTCAGSCGEQDGEQAARAEIQLLPDRSVADAIMGERYAHSITGRATVEYTMFFNANESILKKAVSMLQLGDDPAVSSVTVGPNNKVTVQLQGIVVDGLPASASTTPVMAQFNKQIDEIHDKIQMLLEFADRLFADGERVR